ncbi:MAG: DNA gyrase subunit A [Chitinivibrionales bacterium]|nr:DNA gyrase subunit A [Chitinivibrionales bacterium]
MSDQQRIKSIFIEDEMQKSYLDYSMSMITSRALPDVRDGLKPVHRRVLFGMQDLGLLHNRSPKKCARVVGDVIGKYHPHGDSAVYDTLVRMAQSFSLRYPMVDGQGNSGSVDGDPPAAMRYTECRMSHLAEEMLADIEKETVDFAPNYDDSMQEPIVLPTRVPFLLVNGSTGIAVGMATNMAPHNLGEVIKAVVATIENPEIELPELLQHIPGPDFPTGGVIYGRSGILEAYRSGRGRVIVRAKSEIETVRGDREQIIVSEIPYMVNKANLLEKMADLVRQKVVEGISFLRDESDRRGMRIVIGLKKDAYGEVVLNQLYKYTQLQTTFGINNLALVKGHPRQLNLKQLIELFVEHRIVVVTRRTQFELRKAKERAHILEGYRIALENIDEIVELIKSSPSPDEAKTRLMDRFALSDRQAHEILQLRLQRLTGLERDKIEAEYGEIQQRIKEYTEILENHTRKLDVIKEELLDIKKRFGDERRTEISDATSDVDIEDMIADEDMVITMTHGGYIKRCGASTYRAQGRGGRGIKGMESKDGDYVNTLFIASTHSYILFFTNTGRCYWLKVYKIPEAQRSSRGRPIINLIQLRQDEYVAALVPVREFDETSYIIAATRKGIINKQPLKAYSNVRRDGINAFNIDSGDEVIQCKLTTGDDDIILATRNGQAVRFHESATRELGRYTRGMKGITLRGDDRVVGMVVVKESSTVLTVTEKGYGKQTRVVDYRKTNRGGSGIINIKCTERNGKVIRVRGIDGNEVVDVMLITRHGIVIRSAMSDVSVIGRNTQGVRLMNLAEGDNVIDVALCEPEVMNPQAADGSGSSESGPSEGDNPSDDDTDAAENTTEDQ